MPGDRAVDCTAGNGNDTLFLLKQTAPGGFVHAFDIQASAIEKTRKRLEKAGIPPSCYNLIQDCHSHIAEHVQPGIAACMFNLGYLPGASHEITTEPYTVMKALDSAIDLLKSQGIITVVMYPGHEAGRHEMELLLEFVRSIDEKRCRVMHLLNVNTAKISPSILVLQKL